MLRVSHSLSLLLSLLCFLTVPFFHQTDSALFFLSPCLDLACGTGSPTMRSVLHGLQCWHSSPSCWEFLWVQSQHSHWCCSIPFLTLCSNNSVLTKTTGVRADQLLITPYHQASVIWQSLEGASLFFTIYSVVMHSIVISSCKTENEKIQPVVLVTVAPNLPSALIIASSSYPHTSPFYVLSGPGCWLWSRWASLLQF